MNWEKKQTHITKTNKQTNKPTHQQKPKKTKNQKLQQLRNNSTSRHSVAGMQSFIPALFFLQL